MLLGRIGKGGMAGVYAAWDTQYDEWRAVKVLFPKHARDRSLRHRFETEAQTMMRLNHPNLVRVFDVGHGERLPYIVMELVSSGSLYQWTKTHGPMQPRMAVEAIMQLCSALAEVHREGVVHRDVKPRNVLINWDGALKLTDFGIAQIEASNETRTGLAMGTLGFMSPEQLHDAKSVDHRTDLYAVGATLWAVLTARKARDLFRLDDKPSLMDGVSPPLQAILRRCLAYERDDRYMSAEHLFETFDAVLPSLPEDPAGAPPLPLEVAPPPIHTKPEHTFSEILTFDGQQTPDPGGEARGRARAHSLPLPVGERSFAPDDRPAHVRLTAEDGLPSYMVGVEQPKMRLAPEVIGFAPEVVEPELPPDPAKKRSQVFNVLAATLLLPVAGVLAGILLLGALIGLGAMQLDSASDTFAEACRGVSERVKVAEPLIGDLEVLGADPAPLREAFEVWIDAPTAVAQGMAGAAYVDRVRAAAEGTLAGATAHEAEVVRQRLGRIDGAMSAYVEAHDAWTRLSRQPHARAAVFLGLADGPPASP